MSERSTLLDLPYIQPSQAQKHVTHNEAVELLDLLVQLTVEQFDAETPPTSPAEGATYALGVAPTDAWSGADGSLASFRAGGWMFVTPKEGWRAWGKAEGQARAFSNGAWVETIPSDNNRDGLGIGTSYSPTNRLSVAADASLFTHDGAGHQVKINKANAAETSSLLFQSDWTGHAEVGLAGDTDLSVKVSADGTNWTTGLTVKAVDGSVSVSTVLNLQPGSTPSSPSAGDIYFDSASSVLRCFDGVTWQDLF